MFCFYNRSFICKDDVSIRIQIFFIYQNFIILSIKINSPPYTGSIILLSRSRVYYDSFLYYFDRPDQPVTYLSSSSLTPNGDPVLNRNQLFALGSALDDIRTFFAPIYGTSSTWWAMDVEFKFDGLPGQEPELYVKQARPYQ